MADKPKFLHDCDNCTFLGSFNGHDLYHCMQDGHMPTVIARFGSEGHKYKSGLVFATTDPELGEARRRAADAGWKVS